MIGSHADCPSRRARPARRGFTLLELLVGLTLSVTLLGAMAWFVSDLVETRERLTVASARDGATTAVFERLESDLAFVVTAEGGVAGVSGDATSISVLTRGVLLAGAPSSLGDLQHQEYRFHPESRALLGRRSDATDGRVASGESHDLLGGHLERVRFRYHDGSAWRDEFDSQRDGGLPTLVEVALWWAPHGADMPPDAASMATAAMAPEGDAAIDDPFDLADDLDLENAAAEGELGAGRAPDRLRVIRIPDARPIDPDAVLPIDDGAVPMEAEAP